MAGLRLEGSSVLLTGASGGLGRAIARGLHAKGASLILTARRREVLDDLARETGGEVLVCDLADRADVDMLAERAKEVDVLVANAALPASGRIDDFAPDEIDRALDVNLRAPIFLARAAGPAMKLRGSGHLVFISSLSGKVASAGSSLYSATKFGMRGFAAGLREDLHGSGVGVSVVFPGFVGGEGMWAEAGVELPRGVRLAKPEQVSDAVIKGVEQNKAELDVAPLALRLGAFASAVAPGPAAAVQRRLGARDIADQIAEGQRDKR